MGSTSSAWWSRKFVLIVAFPVLATLIGLAATRYAQKYFFVDEQPPKTQPRTSISSIDAYKRIVADLERRDLETRPRTRYLSLVHRYNDPT